MAGANGRVRRWRQKPARSANQVVVRGMTSLALVWQALWMVGDPNLWPWRQAEAVLAAALGLTIVTWFVLLTTQALGGRTFRRAARLANVVALAIAAVLALVAVSAGHVGWTTASNLSVLCAGIAGVLLTARSAVVVLTVVVAVEMSAALAVDSIATDLLYPAFAAVVAVASISSRSALIQEAAVADTAAATSAQVEAERRVQEGVEATMRQHERALHATVLNTLTAIERGGLTTGMRQRLSARCREAAEVLRELQRRPGDSSAPVLQELDLDLGGAVEDLQAAGTTVHLDLDPMVDVPPAVYVAIRAAVWEALANVSRHAGARHCAVRATVTVDDRRRRVVVEVDDDGRGFAAVPDTAGFGLTEAITRPMADVDGSATVDSSPGRGTRVVLTWEGMTGARGSRAYRPSAAGPAVPVLTAFGLFIAAATFSTLGLVRRPLVDVIALVVLLLVYGAVMAWSRRGPLPTWLVALTVAGASLAFVIQGQAQSLGESTWAEWVSLGVAVVFFVIAGLGPRWAWAVVTLAWLILQGDVLHELLSAGTALLVAGALFGRSVRRNAVAVEHARAVERAQAVALAVADASVRRLRARYAALGRSDVDELLESVASGRLSPDDPQVRRRAAVDERFIRSLIRIDPQADPLRGVVSDVVRAARDAGLRLACDVGDVPLRSSTDLAGLRSSLLSAVRLMSEDGEARLSARREGDDVVVRLFADVADGSQAVAAALEVSAVAVEPVGPAGQPMLWEWRAPAATVAG